MVFYNNNTIIGNGRPTTSLFQTKPSKRTPSSPCCCCCYVCNNTSHRRRSRRLYLLVILSCIVVLALFFVVLFYYFHTLSILFHFDHSPHHEMKQATTSTVRGVVSTRTDQYGAYDSGATRSTTYSSTTNNTKKANTKSNPLAIHCPSLLNDFLHGKVPEMEIRQGFEKSYVTRTNTPNPFYWSTHKGELDMPRHAAFEKGEYYEQELTARVIEAYPPVEKDTKEQEEEEEEEEETKREAVATDKEEDEEKIKRMIVQAKVRKECLLCFKCCFWCFWR
mmetsp:Transcript_13586/g.25516  ORF Transcript_13586/g.25516 Transcript_13586/m.25516 type:complete len:278 (+) Transcript_13586:1317-2150(+)